SFGLAMAVVDRSSPKQAKEKASPKVVGFNLKSSQSCRYVKRSFVARANEKASFKVVGLTLKVHIPYVLNSAQAKNNLKNYKENSNEEYAVNSNFGEQ
ncbi:hypothetical protein Tco_1278407, partial [Tanacetum coccineum]